MNAIPPSGPTAEFQALLELAMRTHASQMFIRLAGDFAQVVMSCGGEEAQVAEWPASRCEEFCAAVFSLCDGAEDFTWGSARSVQMTGKRTELPGGMRSALVQFLPPRIGGRVLVVRITRDGEMCCGTCGG